MNTILLVEDNADNVSLLEDIFQFDRIPARLVVAKTGEEGLTRVVELQPDLVLMDLRLPGIDGVEIIRMLKRNPLTKDIPIWAITAYAMDSDEERARAAGCSEYIVKPVHRRDLVDRLQRFMDQLERPKTPASTGQPIVSSMH